MADAEWLRGVSAEPTRLKREAAKRRKPYEEISVAKSAVQEHLDAGWEVDRELKIKTRLRRQWTHDESLENRVWHLFYFKNESPNSTSVVVLNSCTRRPSIERKCVLNTLSTTSKAFCHQDSRIIRASGDTLRSTNAGNNEDAEEDPQDGCTLSHGYNDSRPPRWSLPCCR